MLDLAIIGGGPAGLLAAYEAARSGVEVAVFEKNQEIGVLDRCAGLLSISGLNMLGIPVNEVYLQNLVNGAVIKTSSGRIYNVDAGRPIAAVVDRRIFDQKLAERAEKRGAKIFCNRRVSDISRSGEIFLLKTSGGIRIKARWIIDAEGAGAALLKRLFKTAPESSKWIPIIQLLVRNHGLDRHYVYIYFKRYLPDFFSYLIPIDEEYGKLGAASRIPNLNGMLKKFLEEEFPDALVLKRISYIVYTGYPIDSIAFFPQRFIPVGDAAGHVKATTGGGVIMGGIISTNIAKAISEHLIGGDPSKFLGNARLVLKELRRIAFLRNLVWRLAFSELYELLLSLLCSSLGNAYLRRRGDMDFQFSALLGSRHSLYKGISSSVR